MNDSKTMIKTSSQVPTKPYPFAVWAQIIKEYEATNGQKILNLGPGSPDFPPAQEWLDFYTQEIQDFKNHKYAGNKPIPEVLNAIQSYYRDRFRVKVKTSEIHITQGAKEAIHILPISILENMDGILLPNPGYPGYQNYQVHHTEYYDLIEGIKLQEIETKLSKKSIKLMWLNFPHNPTGKIIDIQTLTQIVDICRKTNTFIAYDNPYVDIIFDDSLAPSILQVPGAKEIAVEIGSMSKSHSLAGMRLGWIVGQEEVVKAVSTLHSQQSSGMFLPNQKLMAHLLTTYHGENQTKWRQNMLASYRDRRDLLANKLHKLGLKFKNPEGGFYIWAKIPDIFTDSDEYVRHLLEDRKIFVAPGSIFGSNGQGYIRASFCVDMNTINMIK